MACRAIQLNVSSEDTAHVTGLPQSVSSGQYPRGQSSLPPCLRRQPRFAAKPHAACFALERALAEGSRFAVSGAGPSMLCCPVTAGRVAGSGAATRHVWSELHERNRPNEGTSDLNPPSRAFILQSARQVQAGCARERVVR